MAVKLKRARMSASLTKRETRDGLSCKFDWKTPTGGLRRRARAGGRGLYHRRGQVGRPAAGVRPYERTRMPALGRHPRSVRLTVLTPANHGAEGSTERPSGRDDTPNFLEVKMVF